MAILVLLSNFFYYPILADSSSKTALLNFSAIAQLPSRDLQGLAENWSHIVSSFASKLAVSRRRNTPQLTLRAFIICFNPHSIIWIIVGDFDVFSICDWFDSVKVAFLLEGKSLVRCSMEAVKYKIAIICETLRNVDSLQTIAVSSIEDIVFIRRE